MTEMVVQTSPKYDDVQVQTALTAIALASGNVRKASATLEEATGIRIADTTLRKWRDDRYAGEYQRVCEEIAPELQERLAQSDQALVQAAHALEWKALQRMDELVEDASANEAATIYGKVAINSGIHTDKALLRRGQPTEIKQTLNVADALKKLKALAPGLVEVNPVLIGEAEEVKSDLPEPKRPDLDPKADNDVFVAETEDA